MTAARTAYIVDGVRTPIGRYAGALAPVRPDDLAPDGVEVMSFRSNVPEIATLDTCLSAQKIEGRKGGVRCALGCFAC